MEENFDLMAQSRANYYTKGSPVQFVRVELLKGDISGDIAVCLTFKNIGEKPLSGLAIRAVCKNAQGTVVSNDPFYYEDLKAAQGDLFGADEAVLVSDVPVTSVEVELDKAFDTEGKAIPLQNFTRVALPAPKQLPKEQAAQLQQRVGKEALTVQPQVLAGGWYCACGAFHPNEENTVYCSECGSDRILLQNALSNILQKQQDKEIPVEEATRVVGNLHEDTPTRVMPVLTDKEKFEQNYRKQHTEMQEDSEKATAQFDAVESRKMAEPTLPVVDEEEPDEAPEKTQGGFWSDETARKIIRYAPLITLCLCVTALAIGLIIRQFG